MKINLLNKMILDHDENDQEGQLQDIDTGQDSAYHTEIDTDTHNEQSEHTAVDTANDPNFDVEKEKQQNSEVTITADEKSEEKEEESAEVKPIVEKKSRKKREKKKSVKRKSAEKGTNVNEDKEDDFYYYFEKCLNKFSDWKELQKHKTDCVKVPQKFNCSKCNRGF